MAEPPAAVRIAARPSPIVVVLEVLLGAALGWATWPAWRGMAERWSADPRYAHGYLVPGFALVLLWVRRDRLAGLGAGPSWWGLPPIALGAAMQLAGGYVFFNWLEAAALLPMAAGACVLLAGPRSLRWSWPAIAFLIFMLPLPYRLEGALSHPLQRLATKASTYALQTLGFPAVAEGNVIQLDRGPIGVVEACNGLGMLFTFFAISTGVAILIRRPLVDRILVVVSAVPISLVANVARIVVTGALHETVSSAAANVVFHDLAGWLMMPLALGLLGLELGALSRLFVEAGPAPASAAAATPAAGPPRGGPRQKATAKGRSDGRRPESDAIKRALRSH